MPGITHAWKVPAAAAAVLGLVLLGGSLAHRSAAAASSSPVVIVSNSAWGPDAMGYAHLVGEVKNTSATDSTTLIRIDTQLYADVAKTKPIGGESIYVDLMGANIVGPGQTSPYEDVVYAPTFASYTITGISSSVAATPPDHNFLITQHACAGTPGPNEICGTVKNNNPATVSFINVMVGFYNGTTIAGNRQTVDEAMTPITTANSALDGGASVDFDITRDTGAPAYTSLSFLAESATTVPLAPVDVVSVGGNRSAQVSWTAPLDGGLPITHFTVTRNPGGITAVTTDGVTTALAMSGLQNGVSYTFTVSATNALGTSFASAPTNAVVPATVPDAPTGVTAAPASRGATVSWTAPFNEGRPITAYTVTASPGPVSATNDGSSTSLLVPGLDPSVTYTFTVTATNAIGTGPASSPSNAVRPVVAPGPPTNVAAVGGNHSATVSWTPPAFNGGSPIVGYHVTSSPGGLTASGGPSDTSATVSGLINGTRYTFTVTASNAYATSVPSSQSNAVVPAEPPGKPTNVSVDVGPGSAIVSWSAPASSGSSAITSYTVTGNPSGSATVSGDARTAVVAGIPTGLYTFTVTATNTNPGPPSDPTALVAIIAGGQYHAQAPVRILDTRVGIGGFTQPVNGGSPITLQVSGVGGVPALTDSPAPSAVVLNVTVTNPSKASYLTVYPTQRGTNDPPTASNLNFLAGQTVPNLVVVQLGLTGQLSFSNFAGSVDVIADVQGWYSSPLTVSGTAGQLRPVVPARIMDTRTGVGGFASLSAGTTDSLQVAGQGPVPALGASAVVLNVTVTNPSAPSHLIVYPAGTSKPNASNLNYGPGQTVPNRVIVKLGTGGKINVFNLAGSVDVIIDVNGWFTDGSDPSATQGQFTPTSPTRIMDTRLQGGPLLPGEARRLQVTGVAGVPVGATGVVLNVTVTDTSGWSDLIVYPSDAVRPDTSDLNWLPGVTVPNLVVVKLGADGSISIFNLAGVTDVVVDVNGWYN